MNLIERLRAVSETGVTPELIDEAIDRIKELEAENQNLRDSRADMKANHVHDVSELQARLDAVAALPEQWRRPHNVTYGRPDAMDRCADELEQALEQKDV